MIFIALYGVSPALGFKTRTTEIMFWLMLAFMTLWFWHEGLRHPSAPPDMRRRPFPFAP